MYSKVVTPLWWVRADSDVLRLHYKIANSASTPYKVASLGRTALRCHVMVQGNVTLARFLLNKINKISRTFF